VPEARLPEAHLPGAIEETIIEAPIEAIQSMPALRVKELDSEAERGLKMNRSNTEDTLKSVPPAPSGEPTEVDQVGNSGSTDARELPASVKKASLVSLTGPALFGFTDAEEIKSRIRESLVEEKPYSVFDYYHEHGFWQKIAKHERFEHITLGVIVWNALWMYVDTDWNHADSPTKAHWIFQSMDQFFCFFFFGEWFIRFMAFKYKRNGLKDAWFVFDSVLVILMVGETWVLQLYMVTSGSGSENPLGDTSILRLFRLLRLSRLIRMLRSLPELMILIKGMITAMKSVCYVMLLQGVITYVFAIALTHLSSDYEFHKIFFDTVPLSMYSLLIYATLLDDLSYFTDTIREESGFCLVVVMLFIALAALTVMNMLLGVLCEVVSAVAETEKVERMTSVVSSKMEMIINELDSDNNGYISYKEFVQIVQKPEALEALADVGVDPLNIVDFSEVFFFDLDRHPVDLRFHEFMEMVLDLRESNTARVRDVVALWKHCQPFVATVSKEMALLKKQNEDIKRKMSDLLQLLQKL